MSDREPVELSHTRPVSIVEPTTSTTYEPCDKPTVPPSSAEQGVSRTDGPAEVSGPQNGTQRVEDMTPEEFDAACEAGTPVVLSFRGNRANMLTVADRLRTLADADLEAAKDGTRIQRAAAKAAARAYRLAADMIEEEA